MNLGLIPHFSSEIHILTMSSSFCAKICQKNVWKGCTFSPIHMLPIYLKFVYSEKATKFFEISTLLLSTVYTDESKVEILQNFVTCSEYMNFTTSHTPSTKILFRLLTIPHREITLVKNTSFIQFCMIFSVICFEAVIAWTCSYS